MFMKTFEEKWTAWVDGELSGAERAEFEASLDDRAAAEAERTEAHKLGALLKEQLQPRPMGNEEFFHHQLRGRIAAEIQEPPRTTGPARARKLVDYPPLALDRARRRSPSLPSAPFSSCAKDRPLISRNILTQILNARVDPNVSPYATVSIFQTKQDQVTVLWVDGLKSLPPEYAAK